MKKFFKTLFSRVFIVALLMLAQIAAIIAVLTWLKDYFWWVTIVLDAFAVITVLYILNSPSHPSYKIMWILLIALFPIFGGPLYMIFANKKISKRQRKKLEPLNKVLARVTKADSQTLEKIALKDADAYSQMRYIHDYSRTPAYAYTESKYYPLGDDLFPDLLEALKGAKKFIFLEYFIIEPGLVWDRILAVLKEKVALGVDVRILYDDFGCSSTLPSYYYMYLRKLGIKAHAVSRFKLLLDVRMNNRDHRKIAVIDGKYGFTGGMNLADEYINAKVRFGHWKDNGIRLSGEGVYGLTLMFLTHWASLSDTVDDYPKFMSKLTSESTSSLGYVQPYGDIPFDDESVAKNIYLNMFGRAHKYIHAMTPYLILDNEMITALSNAAKQGLDVKIIVPHIPDKKTIFEMTRANYPELIKNGVRIYEYTPGFIHAKMAIADDVYANIGTVNLDYRSLYLHMECGVFLYDAPCIADMEKDFASTLKKSKEITKEDLQKTSVLRRLFRSILNVFAPLV